MAVPGDQFMKKTRPYLEVPAVVPEEVVPEEEEEDDEALPEEPELLSAFRERVEPLICSAICRCSLRVGKLEDAKFFRSVSIPLFDSLSNFLMSSR